jgi:predicted ATPase
VAPPWPEIYATDAERRHGFEAAFEGHRAEAAAYVECGYRLIEVPRAPVEARADFILDQVRKALDKRPGGPVP